ncbi:MAG: GTPase ObgE [Chloroflexota bacterium]
MFNDQARIYIKSGDGGRGVVSFRREKYVPYGGPDGGDGGNGGDVVFYVDDQLATLTPFRYQVHYKAEDGEAGQGRRMHGKDGEDVRIPVPPGTAVYDDETDMLLADLVDEGDEAIILKGGMGGAGNARFRTSTRQAPRIAELGEPGSELWVRLELKLIADVGLVGLPNAGKSTLLAASSAARPKIAEYPFTTLEPMLGVVEVDGSPGRTFVMADIPGVIEGAAEGVGLGHDFLRHIERTRMLLHVLDGSGGLEGRDPVEDFQTIQRELVEYSEELAARPMFIVINKADLSETRNLLEYVQPQLEGGAERIFLVSAVTGEGVPELLNAVYERLSELPKQRPEPVVSPEHRVYTLDEDDEDYWEVEQLSAHHYEVRGRRIERALVMTDFSLPEAADRFQRILEASGISDRLGELGIEPGDVVHIGDDELIWEQELLDLEEATMGSRRKTRRQRLQEQFGEDKDEI